VSTIQRAMREALWLGRRLLVWTLAVTTALSLHVMPVRAQQQALSGDHDLIGKAETAFTIVVDLFLRPTMMVIAYLSSVMPGNSPGNAAGQAMSCPVFAGTGTLLTEDSCVWAKASGQWASQAGTTNSAALFRIGGQKEIAPDWFLGGAFGAGRSSIQADGGNNGAGQLFDGSMALKHTIGPWLIGAALSFSTSSTHFAGNLLQSDVNVYTGGLRLRGAYDLAFDGWYLRPRLDLDLLHTSRPGFSGNAQGVAVLAVDGFTKTNFVATPALELGGRFLLGEKTIVRPYIAAGASYVPTNQNAVSATFVGPLAGLGAFQATFSIPSVFANLEAGLQLYQARGMEMKVEYTLSTGNNYLSQGASLRGAWHF
jgi:outer membrane autotransporter protein